MMMQVYLKQPRRATIVVLFVILLVPLLGMLAFSIDIGYITLVKTDLQTVADSAALAGAEKLQDYYVQYNLPGQTYQHTILTLATGSSTGGPKDTAKKFASYNKAGNVPITLLDQDITFGFTDAQGTYQSSYTGFPNTISVIARRDPLANSPLSLFFGSILGTSSKALTATARATIYSGDVTSLQVIPGVNAHILPVALDVSAWNTFYLTGLSPDGQIHTSANGYPQLKVYPSPGAAPGNFGLLDVGPPQNNVPAFRSWIDLGETPNDISYLLSNNLLPVSLQSPKDWKAGPGLKSTLQSDFYSQLNVPNLLPLFQPVTLSPYQAASGNGQNATYAIVGFAGVKITQADGNGSSMDISIQPAAVVDPTAVISHPAPAGTQTSQFGTSTAITTFISAKLTQ